MAEFEHLPLPEAKVKFERRKKPGWGGTPAREPSTHGPRIGKQVHKAVAQAKKQATIDGVDPSLILIADMKSTVGEDEWDRAGFRIVARDDNQTIIIFSTDVEMSEFKRRLAEYQDEIPEGQKHPRHDGLFSSIEGLASYGPLDRIGPRLRSSGIQKPDDLVADEEYVLDVELWDAPKPELRFAVADKFEAYAQRLGAQPSTPYIGNSGWILVRVIAPGDLAASMLDLVQVRRVDLSPICDAAKDDFQDQTVYEFSELIPPPADAQKIGLIDSGMSAHPLLEGAVFETFGVPQDLGDADEWGHGTKVGAICVYGDIAQTAQADAFRPAFWLCSAKVVDGQGAFPIDVPVEYQMREAIGRLSGLGCRIINISLGDRRAVYEDGKVSSWAAVLDELSREFDVLLVVSAGNANPDIGDTIDETVTNYPNYMLDSKYRIVEPATACNVLTVGALANTNGLPEDASEHVSIQPIAQVNEVAPLSRTGPGVRGAVKPDVIDYGGTLVFDGGLQHVGPTRNSGVPTLSADYLNGLFTTAAGTSYSAPLVTYKAALLARRFPNATPNLLRALLVTASDVPVPALETTKDLAKNSVRRVCGFGHPDVNRALASEERRVILLGEDELPLDEFAVYEVPMLKEFRETKGRRHIRVTLAYDPPVRHTRNDYLGVEMNFRLVRDMTLNEVKDFFRKREKKEGKPQELASRQSVKLLPGPELRDRGTLQSGTYETKVKMRDYGEQCYLVVRCERRWAPANIQSQRYAVTVEMKHEGEIRLHQRLQARLRLRA